MELLACGHPAYPARGRLCRHLLIEEPDDLDRVWILTGVGIEHDVCCEDCHKSGEPIELVQACEGCFERADMEYGVVALRGEPGIAERLEPLDSQLVRTSLPVAPLDIAAVPDVPGDWLLLSHNRVLRWNSETGKVLRERSFQPPKPGVEKVWNNRQPRLRLHAAPGGRFAAVVMDYGRHGLVMDLDRGRVTLELDRETYHTDTTPFPLAFDLFEGNLAVVHARNWCQLDLSDPASGQLLTPRPSEWTRGDRRLEHDRDYFHGALHRSPGGRWLADDGWVWHPAGMPRVWDLRRWRLDDLWTSESEADSTRPLCQRDYHWDAPMCWIGEDQLAISGIGGDDLALIPGVCIFDPATGAERFRFAGPSGPLHSDGHWLYSSGPDGLSRWDPLTGDRTGRLPGFSPTRHHPAGGELIAVDSDTLVRWRIPQVAQMA